jgi:hypothetical protein
MVRPATLGGDLDAALADTAKELLILHGPAACTPAARIYECAAAVADPTFQLVLQFDALAALTPAERDRWFPGGAEGFCVLDVVDRVPYCCGALSKLMNGNEPSSDNIRGAFNGLLP